MCEKNVHFWKITGNSAKWKLRKRETIFKQAILRKDYLVILSISDLNSFRLMT